MGYRSFDWRTFFEIAIALADALAAAREKDIVHRDLKPANIILSDEGRVKVLDFGLEEAAQRRADQRTIETVASHSSALREQGNVRQGLLILAGVPDPFRGSSRIRDEVLSGQRRRAEAARAIATTKGGLEQGLAGCREAEDAVAELEKADEHFAGAPVLQRTCRQLGRIRASAEVDGTAGPRGATAGRNVQLPHLNSEKPPPVKPGPWRRYSAATECCRPHVCAVGLTGAVAPVTVAWPAVRDRYWRILLLGSPARVVRHGAFTRPRISSRSLRATTDMTDLSTSVFVLSGHHITESESLS